MACQCSNCVPIPKPTDCRCPGDKHVSITCFVIAPAAGESIIDLLKALGFTTVRDALLAMRQQRERLDTAVAFNLWG